MNRQDQTYFGGDFVRGALRLVLQDLPKKFDGDLLDLTVLSILASQFELENMLSPAWDRLLEPTSVYQFLLAVGYGYQLCSTNILRHFDGRIREIVKDHLAANPARKVDRNDLIAIVDICMTQANHTLAAENYYDALAEQALETPFDPDFESEQYYEHKARLEVDENYAEMARYNAKLRAEATQKSRREGQVAWVSLLQKSKQLATTGPLEHFRIDLCHSSGHEDTSTWTNSGIFGYVISGRRLCGE